MLPAWTEVRRTRLTANGAAAQIEMRLSHCGGPIPFAVGVIIALIVFQLDR